MHTLKVDVVAHVHKNRTALTSLPTLLSKICKFHYFFIQSYHLFVVFDQCWPYAAWSDCWGHIGSGTVWGLCGASCCTQRLQKDTQYKVLICHTKGASYGNKIAVHAATSEWCAQGGQCLWCETSPVWTQGGLDPSYLPLPFWGYSQETRGMGRRIGWLFFYYLTTCLLSLTNADHILDIACLIWLLGSYW